MFRVMEVQKKATEPVAPQSGWPSPVEDSRTHGFFLADLLEYNSSSPGGALEWDLLGWRGGDYDRFWFKSSGLQRGTVSDGGTGEVQALFGHLIAPFFDLQAGVSYQRHWGRHPSASRFQGVLSLQGLAPYSFEIEPVLFISQSGDVSVRFTAAQDLLLTQRGIVQFRFEINAALQKVEAFDIGSGVNDLSLGLRLRYEFLRELAPYVGLAWNPRFGESSSFQEQGGPELSGFAIVAGLRAWY